MRIENEAWLIYNEGCLTILRVSIQHGWRCIYIYESFSCYVNDQVLLLSHNHPDRYTIAMIQIPSKNDLEGIMH